MKKISLILLIFIILTALILGVPYLIYVKGLPQLVKNKDFIQFVQQKTHDLTGMDLTVVEPELITKLDNNVGFSTKSLKLVKDNVILLDLENFDVNLSLIVKNYRVIFNTLWADFIYIDVDGLLAALPQTSEEEQNYILDFFHSVLYVKDLKAKYSLSDEAKVLIDAKDLIINASDDKTKYFHFDAKSYITKRGKTITVSAADEDKVYLKDNKLIVDNINLNIEKSKVLANVICDYNYKFKAKFSSENFEVNDVVALINSKLLDENTAELLTYFNDIKGIFDFKINISNDDISGDIKLKKLFFKLKYMENLPVLITQGKINITKNIIKLDDFKGYYNNIASNKLDFNGSIKDYFNSFDTNIVGNAVVTNDFAKNYLSKFIGYPIKIKGKADTRLMYQSKFNKIDLLWLYKFGKGTGFELGDETFGDTTKERVLVSKMHIKGAVLNIESMDYFMGSPKDKDFNNKPILSFYGNVDMAHNCNLLNFGFKIPDALTANFLNMLVKQDIFRRGTVKGNLEYVNKKGKIPYLNGNLTMEKTGVPSQRMYIRNANIKTNGDLLAFSSEGKYKRSDYKINGNVLNRVSLPVVVKNVDLKVDNIDVEKFLASANNQNQIQGEQREGSLAHDNTEEADDVPTFDLSTLIVENGKLNLVKGKYKDINFSNVLADMTFDKNQVLEIKSNRFDFAKGISSAKIVCDLKNQLYSVKLGVKNVDSDLIATTLLNVKKEITGKASGFINLNTDDSFKLNGQMMFNIKNGSIAKIGLFEYVLKFTSIFRNPIVSISPSTVSDFVNVPNGDFDLIKGTLEIKDNVVKKISITSSAPQMASYIAGKYDLNTNDAALRIYIKYSNKNKGFYGVMRNISLGSLANRIPFGAKSSNNYYEREIEKIPALNDVDEKDCHIYLTKVDGDIENNNFISFLKKLK